MATYTNIKTLKIENSYTVDAYGQELTVAKMKTGRWFLADTNGNVIKSARSEQEIGQAWMKIESRRMNGNLMGFRFGSKIDETVVEDYIQAVWGDLFEVAEIEFDGHYWWVSLINNEGLGGALVRADYFINYLRIPHGCETEEAVNRAKELGARV